MNQSIKIFSFLLFVFAFACTSTNKTSSSKSNSEDSLVLVKDLPRHINTIPRLTVRGSGTSATVINTSVATSTGEYAPLIVLDGVTVGRSLARVMQILDQNQRVSVEFLSTRRATVRYGEEGRSGALIIKTQ